MLSLVDIRKAALALFMGALLVVAVIPVCQMIACDAMVGVTWSSPAPTLAASCAPPVTGWLTSSNVAGTAWSSTVRLATMLVAFALAALVLNRNLALSESRVLSPPADPLGVRILI